MKINSVYGMLELLKAIRKTAIRDQKAYNFRGFNKGEDAWEEWKESQCRFLYHKSFILLCEVEKSKNKPMVIPKGESSW